MTIQEDTDRQANDVLALMRGDPATFQAGYSFANALNLVSDLEGLAKPSEHPLPGTYGISTIRLCMVAEAAMTKIMRGEL